MNKETVDAKQLNSVKKTTKKQASNPIAGVDKAPKVKVQTKSMEQVASGSVVQVKPEKPASKDSSNLVATINNFNANKTYNRLYSGYANNPISSYHTITGSELANAICASLKNRTEISELFVAIHSTLSEKLNTVFTGFGLYHETSKCIDFKLYSKIGGTYSSKVFQSDVENPIMECFTNQFPIMLEDNKFLNIPYLKNSQTV